MGKKKAIPAKGHHKIFFGLTKIHNSLKQALDER